MPVSGYVEACDLLQGPSIREATIVAPAGTLTLEALGAVGDPPPGHLQFLRFVPKPMNAVELRRWRNRPDRPIFHARGRLARVGLPARLVDAGLMTSLLLRGQVPGGTQAAAQVRYAAIREHDPRVAYHARVVRTDGWVVLHYLFFYAMNDWRSTFDGANDHEADLEQCFVVLEELPDGAAQPAWFCAAAHDEKGDDLRRRWDDPRLETVDGHPIVYPGAGSHATYLERGEYIMRLPFPGERNLRGPLDLLRRVWRDTLDQPDPATWPARWGARSACRSWTTRAATARPSVRDASTSGRPSSSRTRTRGSTATAGCGASTRATGSPASARRPGRSTRARAPSASRGPTRWASRVSPRSRRRPGRRRCSSSGSGRSRRSGMACATRPRRSPGPCPASARRSRRCGARWAWTATRRRTLANLRAEEAKLAALRARDVELTRVIAEGRVRLEAIRSGVADDPRAHLHHASEPEAPSESRRRAYGEAWAALSVGLLIVLLAVVVWLRILPPIVAIPVVFGGYLAIEAFFDRSVGTLLLRIAMFLAIVSAIILAVTFIRELVLLGLARPRAAADRRQPGGAPPPVRLRRPAPTAGSGQPTIASRSITTRFQA